MIRCPSHCNIYFSIPAGVWPSITGQGDRLWSRRLTPIHDMIPTINPDKTSGVLFFFHAFNGCDVVSAFRGKGKKTEWQTRNVFAEVSDVFQKLNQNPPTVGNDDLEKLELFVVTMNSRSSTATHVNGTRLELFAQKQQSYESIPPTQAALLQHSKHAVYQAGCTLSQSTVCQPEILQTGDGCNRKKEGRSVGLHFHRLRKVAKN